MLASRRVVFFFVAVLLFLFVACPGLVFAQGGAIDSARQQLVSCFEAAARAEGAGANITSLTSVLNDAGALLSRAESAYAAGDSGAASDFAGQCVGRLDGFVASADALRVAAEQRASFDFWVFFVGSIGGTFVVLGGAYALWVFLRRRYGVVEVRAGES